MNLPPAQRFGLRLQRALSYLVGNFLIWPITVVWMRAVRGYRIRQLREARVRVRTLLAEAPGPVLVCPNHLTWVDSMLVQWALTSPTDTMRAFKRFAWNLPEYTNFWAQPWLRMYCYLSKCIPITRGGDRAKQALVLEKARWALERGDLVTVFPESGRSRSGHVDSGNIAHGVGRLIRRVDDCRVLCVYLRGEGQHVSTFLPRKGERFTVDMELLQPRTDMRGLRATRELARQVVAKLGELEQRTLAGR